MSCSERLPKARIPDAGPSESCEAAYMTRQARAYCEHIRGLKLRKDAAQASYEEAARSIDGLRALRYDRAPHAGTPTSGDDAVALTLERIAEAADRMAGAVGVWEMECEVFDRLCERLTPVSAYILAMRYRNALKWDLVSQRVPYAPEYVRGALHERALVEMYGVMPGIWR